MPPAVVFGLDVNGLGVVRALGRLGVPVVGIYSSGEEIGRFSRYGRAIRLPAGANGGHLVSLLFDIFEGFQVSPVLFATSDAYANWLAEYQNQLRSRFVFHAIRLPLHAKINSKLGLMSLVNLHGVDTPWTSYFERLEEFELRAPDFPYPIIVKPVDTFRHALPGRVKNLVFGNTPSLISYVRSQPTYLKNMIFQEVIPSGDGRIYVCTILLNRAGNLLLSYTGRKIRQYLPDYGVTCFGVSERIGELVDISSSFMNKLGYCGVATLEFVRDPRTDRFLLLEVNPRSYYHNQLFTDCGLNFPWTEYCSLTQRQVSTSEITQRVGVYWIDFNNDLGSFYLKYGRGQLGFIEWLRSVLRARSFATLAADDLLPFLARKAMLFYMGFRLFLRQGRRFFRELSKWPERRSRPQDRVSSPTPD